MANDQLQRFVFDDSPVRGEIARLDDTLGQVLARKTYPAAIERLLGELLTACALLTATVKLEGTLSIEIRSPGALSLLMAESHPGQADAPQGLRAIARFDGQAGAALDDGALDALAPDAKLLITLDPEQGQRYQGVVALDKPSIAGCLEDYFKQSEQLPTRLWLAADSQRAAGLLIQKLPENEPHADSDAWDRINHLADTLTEAELTELASVDVLRRLFHEERTRLFTPTPVMFRCTCSRQRFGRALHQLGAGELRDILAEQGRIETQCHFCNTVFVFSAADAEALIDDPDAPAPTLQ